MGRGLGGTNPARLRASPQSCRRFGQRVGRGTNPPPPLSRRLKYHFIAVRPYVGTPRTLVRYSQGQANGRI